MNDEGVIKFNCEWTRSGPLDDELIKDLNFWRQKMHQLGLIGVNEDGIGYGNISLRFRKNEFIISGSGTGKLATLTGEHYAFITAYDVKRNSVCSTGATIASSESLTHAMIYEYASDMHAVIHVHHLNMWKKLLETLPGTAGDIAYGTPEMANEIARLFKDQNLYQNKIFGMAGHHGGVVSFGKSLEEAAGLLIRLYNNFDD
jgi:L-ribulose-5-phosphate 4-epimerase